MIIFTTILMTLLIGNPTHVIPSGQATLFGDAIVAHAYGDGRYFDIDEMLVVYDDARPVKMCAVDRYVVDVDDYARTLREQAGDGNLELITCVPGGVRFIEFQPCSQTAP